MTFDQIAGDRLVETSAANSGFDFPSNETVQIIYPTNSDGAVISFVEIVVTQVRKRTSLAHCMRF